MSKLTTFNMPLGPVHVALEEPVYFNLTVEGETIRKVELTSGHVRGTNWLDMEVRPRSARGSALRPGADSIGAGDCASVRSGCSGRGLSEPVFTVSEESGCGIAESIAGPGAACD